MVPPWGVVGMNEGDEGGRKTSYHLWVNAKNAL